MNKKRANLDNKNDGISDKFKIYNPILVLILGVFTLNIFTLIWLYRSQKSLQSNKHFVPNFWILLSPIIAIIALLAVLIPLAIAEDANGPINPLDNLLLSFFLGIVVLSIIFVIYWIYYFSKAFTFSINKEELKWPVFAGGLLGIIAMPSLWLGIIPAIWIAFLQYKINSSRDEPTSKISKLSLKTKRRQVFALVLGAVVVIVGIYAFIWNTERNVINAEQAEAIIKETALRYCQENYSPDDCKDVNITSDLEGIDYGPTDGNDEYIGTWVIYSRANDKTILVSLDREGKVLYVNNGQTLLPSCDLKPLGTSYREC